MTKKSIEVFRDFMREPITLAELAPRYSTTPETIRNWVRAAISEIHRMIILSDEAQLRFGEIATDSMWRMRSREIDWWTGSIVKRRLGRPSFFDFSTPEGFFWMDWARHHVMSRESQKLLDVLEETCG